MEKNEQQPAVPIDSTGLVGSDAPLLALVLEIRDAAGDPYGKLMQDELVEKIRELKKDSERLDHLESNAREMPRWAGTPSMDGSYPCWIGYAPKYGKIKRKTLREMLDAAREHTTQAEPERRKP